MDLTHQPWNLSAEELAKLDQRYIWHPFTQMAAWCAEDHEPLVLASGKGARVTDVQGREYIDGNSSIWTNIHGHQHPKITAAMREQLDRMAHSSFLGLTHPNAAVLARELVTRAPGDKLTKVFFSDNGSTANEVSLRMALQFRAQREEDTRTQFVAFDQAYHGDTVGAANLSGIPLFTHPVAGPFPPVTRVADVDELLTLGPDFANTVNAAIIEPLVQGPAGIRPWPKGMLRRLADWCEEHGVLLILDEVLTGFGRTGTLFACEQENVVPDFLNLAKGITGGYLPLAVTLTTDQVFEAFLGGTDRTFYYGHSYTANPVGCAAALASLEVFDEEAVLENLQPKIAELSRALANLEGLLQIGEIRQCGFLAAIEVSGITPEGRELAETNQLGAAVCRQARDFGLLTRPIRNAVILMLPLCATNEEISAACAAIGQAVIRY